MDRGLLLELVRKQYGERLLSLAIFGSRVTGDYRPDSDIDLLVVCDVFPGGRMARTEEWLPMEADWSGPYLSPLFYTPVELKNGSPVFLNLTLGEIEYLYDPQNLLKDYIDDLSRRLRAMGARRIGQGKAAYWDMGRRGSEVVL